MQLTGVAEEYLWKDHGNSYPIPEQLAELFLGISDGSVPV